MKKTFTLILLLNMTFFVNEQLRASSDNFSLIENVENQQNLISKIQKATSHVNFLSETNVVASRVKYSKSELLDSIVTKDIAGKRINKTTYSYDSNGNDTTEIVYNWDDTSSKWILFSKIRTIKDNNGQITLYESYTMLGGIFLIGSSRYVATYNSNNQKLSVVNYQWDFISSSWKLYTKTENTYDANKNLITSIDFNWTSGISVWINNAKTEYSYKANKVDIETDYSWNASSSTWTNSTKNAHYYSAQGNDTLVLGFKWNIVISNWDTANKIVYVYDVNNYLTGMEFWDWNINTNAWEGAIKQDYGFDSNKNLTLSVLYMWDTNTSAWIGFQKFTISYYSNTTLEQNRITYSWVNNSWVENTKDESIYNTYNDKSIDNNYLWNIGTSTWDKNQISTYYYSLGTGIPSVVGQNLNIYPNPTTTELHINGLEQTSSVRILDINAKVIFVRQNTEGIIDVSFLHTGIYFLQITNKTGITNYKFIKL